MAFAVATAVAGIARVGAVVGVAVGVPFGGMLAAPVGARRTMVAVLVGSGVAAVPIPLKPPPVAPAGVVLSAAAVEVRWDTPELPLAELGVGATVGVAALAPWAEPRTSWHSKASRTVQRLSRLATGPGRSARYVLGVSCN